MASLLLCTACQLLYVIWQPLFIEVLLICLGSSCTPGSQRVSSGVSQHVKLDCVNSGYSVVCHFLRLVVYSKLSAVCGCLLFGSQLLLF